MGIETWSGKIGDLRVGDLIIVGKLQRLIRAKTLRFNRHGNNLAGYYFWFAIRRSSWTNSCHTMLTDHDMKMKFGGLLKRNVDLARSDLEYRVQQEIFRCAYVSDYKGYPREKQPLAEEMAGRIL